MTGLLALAWLLPPITLLLVLMLLSIIFAQRRRIRQLLADSRHDPLTGLPNRRGLAPGWHALEGPRALILIDLVGFKAVNDSHGHLVGDKLLKQVAERLAAAVPAPGLLARWGGDEFAAAIPADSAAAVRAAIAEASARPYVLITGVHPVLATIGARTGLGTGKDDLDEAIAAAANSLHEAKAGEEDSAAEG
ncbi:GGDEF domain-containing protein [Sandaracinobacter neustonicus]|uniref:GGDEF domain-containing protein n=1 Tax=Sandaracinobacter neustonicus TaxID=1715348 RepID=UPI001F17EDDF|nr:GGDEF domain-containing protein [Sandaracinobacter neustonicus]